MTTFAILLLWGDESGDFLLDGDESGDLILWGDEAATTEDVTTTTETGTRQLGGGGHPDHGPAIGRADWDERKRIAAQLKALYREVYDGTSQESPAADEAAALVADYVPTSAPDFPPPNAVDWEMVAEETRAVIAHMRNALQALALHKQRQADDEEAVIALLLAN